MIRQTLLVISLALPSFAAVRGDVIFDNVSGGNHGITTTSQAQIANQITSALGAALTVTELDMGFTSQGVAATVDLQAFLYANDGINGAPGTVLWQSLVMRSVAINSTNLLVSFAVPSVLVPRTFSFAAAITNASAVVGYAPALVNTAGTFNQAYAGSPGTWQNLGTNFQIEGQIISAAVPEPASMILVGLGFACVVGMKRRKA